MTWLDKKDWNSLERLFAVTVLVTSVVVYIYPPSAWILGGLSLIYWAKHYDENDEVVEQ